MLAGLCSGMAMEVGLAQVGRSACLASVASSQGGRGGRGFRSTIRKGERLIAWFTVGVGSIERWVSVCGSGWAQVGLDRRLPAVGVAHACRPNYFARTVVGRNPRGLADFVSSLCGGGREACPAASPPVRPSAAPWKCVAHDLSLEGAFLFAAPAAVPESLFVDARMAS